MAGAPGPQNIRRRKKNSDGEMETAEERDGFAGVTEVNKYAWNKQITYKHLIWKLTNFIDQHR